MFTIVVIRAGDKMERSRAWIEGKLVAELTALEHISLFPLFAANQQTRTRKQRQDMTFVECLQGKYPGYVLRDVTCVLATQDSTVSWSIQSFKQLAASHPLYRRCKVLDDTL